jgi:flagellar biosynthesis protein FlhF
MTIKKFTGNTRDEAIQNAKKELGDSVVIMNVKEVRPKGVFGIFKTSTYEVTAALEDDATPVRKNPSAALGEGGHFDAVAGERGVVNHVEPKRTQPMPSQPTESKTNETALAEESLRSAFAAVNEVIFGVPVKVVVVPDVIERLFIVPLLVSVNVPPFLFSTILLYVNVSVVVNI